MLVKAYSNDKVPPKIKEQILTFLKTQWPEGFKGKNKDRNWISRKEFHATHLVLQENDNVLISHVAIVWKYLKHKNIKYKTYGLSGVFTVPHFRKKGYGQYLIKKAKEHIEKQDGDIVLFTSCLLEFYEQAGFVKLNNTKLLKGDPTKPEIDKANVFMLFLSDKAKRNQEKFENESIYFGEETW